MVTENLLLRVLSPSPDPYRFVAAWRAKGHDQVLGSCPERLVLRGVVSHILWRVDRNHGSNQPHFAAAFKLRSAQAYREHHRRFHDALPEFQAALMTAKKKSAALGLLNTIVELGTPDGAGLEKELATLAVVPAPCPQDAMELDLATKPTCPECQIELAQTVPTIELARLTPQVEKALASRADERRLEFLQIVQASELSSLANTLDNDLVAFNKQVLE